MRNGFFTLPKRLKKGMQRLKSVYHVLFAPHKAPLNKYNLALPHPQQMINLFDGEWISSLPPPHNDLQAGVYPLFEDPRVLWAIEQFGGVLSRTIVELGPLEGGHSYMLQQHGASSVTAVEANPRAFMKCLIVKEIMKLSGVQFLFGDFNEFLRSHQGSFDVCFASGVLYHMKDPIALLSMISEKCSQLFLWTHYFDEKICRKGVLKAKFGEPVCTESHGLRYTVYPFNYGSSRMLNTFIGGPEQSSSWLARDDILKGLNHFGFTKIETNFEGVDEVHGPYFSLTANKG